MKPTPEEVAIEIKTLEALTPSPGPYQQKQRDYIELEIQTLKGQIDETAEEFREMGDEEQDVYANARAWLDGQSRQKPSESWAGLVS